MFYVYSVYTPYNNLFVLLQTIMVLEKYMFERNKIGPEISKTKKLLLLICNLKQLMCSAYIRIVFC